MRSSLFGAPRFVVCIQSVQYCCCPYTLLYIACLWEYIVGISGWLSSIHISKRRTSLSRPCSAVYMYLDQKISNYSQHHPCSLIMCHQPSSELRYTEETRKFLLLDHQCIAFMSCMLCMLNISLMYCVVYAFISTDKKLHSIYYVLFLYKNRIIHSFLN